MSARRTAITTAPQQLTTMDSAPARWTAPAGSLHGLLTPNRLSFPGARSGTGPREPAW